MRQATFATRRAVPALAAALLLSLAAGCGGGDETGPPTGGCDAGTIQQYADPDHSHVPAGTDVTYVSNPPCIGPHYGTPVSTGYYPSGIAPETWVHNLEHGAITFLYDCPGSCTDVVLGLRDFAEARPADAGGAFRYVITPLSGMPTKVAVVAWGWVYRADCVDVDEIDAFVDAHYRRAPEDIPTP